MDIQEVKEKIKALLKDKLGTVIDERVGKDWIYTKMPGKSVLGFPLIIIDIPDADLEFFSIGSDKYLKTFNLVISIMVRKNSTINYDSIDFQSGYEFGAYLSKKIKSILLNRQNLVDYIKPIYYMGVKREMIDEEGEIIIYRQQLDLKVID